METEAYPAGMPPHHPASRMAFAMLVRELECVIEWEMDFLSDTPDTPMDRGELLEGEGISNAALTRPPVWLEVWTTCRRSRLRRPHR